MQKSVLILVLALCLLVCTFSVYYFNAAETSQTLLYVLWNAPAMIIPILCYLNIRNIAKALVLSFIITFPYQLLNGIIHVFIQSLNDPESQMLWFAAIMGILLHTGIIVFVIVPGLHIFFDKLGLLPDS